jgi:flagellar biosynthesis component FlhA
MITMPFVKLSLLVLLKKQNKNKALEYKLFPTKNLFFAVLLRLFLEIDNSLLLRINRVYKAENYLKFHKE